MSYQYPDRGGPYGGRPDNTMAPPPVRRPPPQDYRSSPPPDRQQRGPPPVRPPHPGSRPPVRPPPPQQYVRPPPPPTDSTENLYDGSAYGGAEDEDDNQWPLPSRPFAQQGGSGSPSGSPRRPPQRPQRPDYQDPVLDPPRPLRAPPPASGPYQQPAPPPQSHHGSGQWTGDGYSLPQQNIPFAQPQRPPPQSSHAPIPDYQQMPLPPQLAQYVPKSQRPPLGPPPSARRGPPSYYPQIAPVHPIAEETDSMRGSIRDGRTGLPVDPSHSSYASSNAIPIGIPDYYLEGRDSVPSMPEQVSDYGKEYDDSPVTEQYEPEYEDGRTSRMEEREQPSPEPAALIRQASLGKKSKPTLTTVKSGERMRKDSSGEGISSLPSRQRGVATPKEALTPKTPASRPSYEDDESVESGSKEKEKEKEVEAVGGAAALAATLGTAGAYATNNKSRDKLSNRTPSSDVLSSGTGLLDPSSSESEKSIKKMSSKELLNALAKEKQSQRSQPRSPLAPAVDPRVEKILGELEKGGALSPEGTEKLKQTPGSLSERAGRRRPPRLDVDAVRDAEARGSLTSLPELIKRATRLASNLDRGKTASRLGMNFFDSDSEEEKTANRHSNGSISNILASFPPPGLATPPGSRGGEGMRRSLTQWPSNLRHSHLPSDSDAGASRTQQKRKCCGMPLWLFLLLLVVLVLLVAAAIIVPVVLIVVPRQQKSSGGDSTADLTSCRQNLSCLNGGTNILSSDGVCRCVCVQGYTGSTCGTLSQAGCTSTSVGTTTDATVGNEIPRLLSGAASNFSVPLDGQALLGLFSASDLSCSSENALVTFNNVQERRRAIAPNLLEAREAASPTTGSPPAATSNGIVFESGTPNLGSPSTSASAPSPSASGSAGFGTTLDFARVAVLYIFQSSGQLNAAVTAQDNLQSYFSTGQTSTGQTINAKNVSLGNGTVADLPGRSIRLGNGTVIGG